MKISVNALRGKVVAGIQKLGYTGEDAKVIADVLLYAQLRGNNQGITKIATGGVPKASDIKPFRIVAENKCGVLMSGGHSMVAAVKAAYKVTELANEHGVGIVGINHTFTSSGAIGYYTRIIAKQGYIGIVCVGNGQLAFVAPSGSAEGKLGTNPLSYAFPYNDGEVVFDITTAGIAYFGVVEAKLKGEPLPEGIGYDKDGDPTTKATDVLEGGAVTTFAAHKGFGLSLLVQLLGGPFSLASIPGIHKEDGAGTFVMAIDPGLLSSKEEFMNRASELVGHIKSAEPLPGQYVILPGENGDILAKKTGESGEIEIADAIWQELNSFVDK
jgi:LDH2 family malate/lactate/ureidoglycolate dehydrogenase